jgi:Holliday junction resolvasome RuvABC endonuclease subunit
MPCILGVDPGVTGGLAFFNVLLRTVHVYDIPAAAGEVDAAAIIALLEHHIPAEAFVERAQSMPKQGVASTFKYGAAYGTILGVLAVGRIPTHRVTPAKWKKAMGLDSDKEKSRLLAIRLFPGCGDFTRKKDHGRAEAALIARYGAGVLGLLGQQVAA